MYLVKYEVGISQIAGVGNSTERNQLAEGENLFGEAMEDDLGMELFELSHG